MFKASIYFHNKIIRKFAEDRKKFIDDLDI